MGIPRLAERVAHGPYWQLVSADLTPGEMPIHLAHLRCVQGAQDFSGTLFVTTRRVIWRTIDPRLPEGSAFEFAFADLDAVDQPSRFMVFHAFRLVTQDNGRPVDTYFFPQHKSEADRLLCDQMYDAVLTSWRQDFRLESATG